MKPGETTRSEASMVRAAPSLILPISAMRPFATATSARVRGAPVPSTMVPFLITRSYAMAFLQFALRSQLHPVELRCIPGDHLASHFVGQPFEILGDHLERVGPGRIGMREVGGPHVIVLAEVAIGHRTDHVVLEGDPHVAAHIVTRLELEPDLVP